ncbi:MAG TPA: amino acid permease [Ktedonobacteraceae bacterium]|jgi:amino acid efflux transporter|nr:amino acid permease [Ktedonobacteraceae bacterium]
MSEKTIDERSKLRRSSSAQFSRSISLPQAIALYVGAVVGAGVLILPGIAANMSGPGSLVAWAFDGILGLPLALTFAFLAARFPDAGGVAAFTRRAFGTMWGGIVGWFYFFGAAVAQVVVPLTGGYYVSQAFGWGRLGSFVVAALILALAVSANLYGLRLSGRIQLLLSGGVVLILLVATIAALPHMKLTNLTPLFPHGFVPVGHTMILLFFAFFGWEAIAQLSEEFRDPARDIVRSTIFSVAIVTLLYLAASLAVVATGMYGTAGQDRVAIASLIAASFGGNTRVVTAVIAVLITLGTANAYIAATSRLGYALGRDGAFPQWMSSLNTRAIPVRAILAIGGFAAGGLALCYFLRWEAEQLLVVPTSLGLATYIIGTAAGVRLLSRWKRLVSGGALLLCSIVLPFASASIFFPLILAGAAFLYMKVRKQQAHELMR